MSKRRSGRKNLPASEETSEPWRSPLAPRPARRNRAWLIVSGLLLGGWIIVLAVIAWGV
jgi:hypothetical protein